MVGSVSLLLIHPPPKTKTNKKTEPFRARFSSGLSESDQLRPNSGGLGAHGAGVYVVLLESERTCPRKTANQLP